MTKTVATVRSDARIADAITKLVEHRVSGLPVVNELGRLVGMVTEGDLLRRVELGTAYQPPKWLGFLHRREQAARDYVRDHTRRVGDIMTPHPVSVDEATPLDQVVELMERHGIRRVPVVAKGGLVGIVSRSDLVRLLGQIMRADAMVLRDDGAIRQDLLAELERQAWFKACKVAITVESAIVRFKGTVEDGAIETALRAAAESTRGVMAVKMAIAVGPPDKR